MSSLPSVLAAAKPVPAASRTPWYKTVMPTYIGIMLWFVFWQAIVNAGVPQGGHPAGVLSHPYWPAFLGLTIAAIICHFLFYLAPGLLGMRTGLPLCVVGTSTYGASGGRYMPGFLMGILQFGWLAVNAAAVASILCNCFGLGMKPNALETTVPGWPHAIIATTFIVVAALVGVKGIRYVARVATYLPLIPVIVLLGLFLMTAGGLGDFSVEKLYVSAPADSKAIDVNSGLMSSWEVVAVLCVYVVGFFATAGAAGADIASNCRNDNDVHIGGITGILLPTVLAGEITILIVAGAYGGDMVQKAHIGNYNPVELMSDILQAKFGVARGGIIANITMIALAISSFPAACFSSLIAANSFTTTMPRVRPLISVGVGALVAVVLATTDWTANVLSVFQVIGASFGPVCGAMLADFLLARRKWSGPRAGFNPAGWISWIIGFGVGAFNLIVPLMLKWDWATRSFPHLSDYRNYIPVPPLTAFAVGFALYVVLSVVGLRTRKLLTAEGKLID
jgi:cytosine permease